MTEHKTVHQALSTVRHRLKEAEQCGSFLIGIWCLGKDGKMVCHRTTWQFPSRAVEDVIGTLKETFGIKEEVLAPLPLAEFLKKSDPIVFDQDVKSPILAGEVLGPSEYIPAEDMLDARP